MHNNNRRVLCVDDEPLVLKGLRRQLRKCCDVVTVVSPEEGLRRIDNEEAYAAVVSDYNMPGMNGSEFLREVLKRSPDTTRIMLTGRADLRVAVGALHEGRIFRFLEKPCDTEILVATIQDALRQHELVTAEHRLTCELNRANEELRCLNGQLERRVADRTATIRELYEFVAALHGMTSVREVTEAVVRMAAGSLNSQCACIRMPSRTGDGMSLVASGTLSSCEPLGEQTEPCRQEWTGVGRSEPCQKCAEDPTDAHHCLRLRFHLGSNRPVEKDEEGTLSVSRPLDDRPFSDEDRHKLQAIIDASTTAIQNQIRFRQRNDARDAVILAMAKLAEHRDPETGAHLERVQHYCRLLCEVLARTSPYNDVVDHEFIEHIVRSSPLHDIGKVGIPDNILLKPGKLSEEEFAVMKTHAQIGGDTIAALVKQRAGVSFLEMGMEIAYHHHEKYDGSGYPYGLAGKAIPLPARILALADVYDALTSKRVYKDAMPHHEAARIICEGSGTHFDPDIVEAFLQQEQAFAALRIELPDLQSPAEEALVKSLPELVRT